MLNNGCYVGRLVADPELRYYEDGQGEGNPYVKFTLAVERNYTDESGENPVDFLPITVMRMNAEQCAEYLEKGSLVSVTAEYRSSRYEDDEGNMQYSHTLMAKEPVQFLSYNNKEEDNKEGLSEQESKNKDFNPNEDIPFE